MLRLKVLLLFIFAFAGVSAYTQLTDDFSDGDFSNNPTWVGDVADWEVLAGRLHLNAPAANATKYLSTPSIAINNATWEWSMELTANPSSTNFVEVFLTSNQTNLTANPIGYLVRIGNTTDEVSLYYSNGTTKTEIIDGIDGRVNVNNPDLKVMVTRDAAGNWALFSDTTGSSNSYVAEGTVNHVLSTTSAHFGVLTTFTSTRNTWCFFDSINVTGVGVIDLTPPTVLSVTPVSSTVADVVFSENVDIPTAQTTTNYLLNTSTNPASAIIQAGDSARVRLTFVSPFPLCTSQSLDISNVEDRASNVMVATNRTFNYAPTGTAGYKSVIISEIMADPTTPAPICLPALEYLELFNRGNVAVNLQGWTISDGAAPVTIITTPYILCPGQYVLLTTDTTVFTGMPHKIDVPSFPSLNNAGDPLGLRSNLGVLLDSVHYDLAWYQDPVKDDGGWSIELINPTDTCSGASNWIASVHPCGGTPGAQNSVYSTTPDITPPSITSISVTGLNSLQVCFSEVVDPIYLNVPGNYSVNSGLGTPSSATAASSTCVDLIFATNIVDGTLYTLTATNIQDCQGNNAPSTEDFIRTGPAAYKAVVINEIFPDPDSALTNMPPVEYVELYNRSSAIFNLAGWVFQDPSSSQVLTNHLLYPGDYLILCKAADTAWFTGLPYLGLSSMPSLNNTDDRIGLRDFVGNLVDTVSYTAAWYQDPTKDDGGWSLELINPSDTCAMLGNWIASNDPDGGTPGTQNSVFNSSPDLTGPALLSVGVTGPNTLEVCFDETLDPGSLVAANFSVNAGIGTASTATSAGTAGECVTLTFATNFTTGQLYTLTATNIADCKGNTGTGTANFLVSGPAPAKAVIINEIFPDPDSALTNMPPVEYVELHNRSTQIFDLGGWTLSDPTTTSTVSNHILAPGAYVILCKASDTAWFTGLPYAPMLTMPSLNNTDDQLGLRDHTGGFVDTVMYDILWYQDPTKDDGGWSLELINPEDTCSMLGNWIASNDPDGGTPGAQNSVYNNAPDLTPPTIMGITITGPNTVELCFDETMDLSTLSTASNFTVNNGIGAATTAIPAGDAGECVTLTFPSSFVAGTVYTLTATNVADCKGNTSTDDIDFLISPPASPDDIIFNEIYADPDTLTANMPPVEFVELYNRSTSMYNLAGWVFSDPGASVPLGNYLLAPGDYVVLCKTADLSYFAGLPALGLPSLPSLNNTGDQLGLRDQFGTLIDSVEYDIAWYQNPSKDDGGWTLELINPNATCIVVGNWIASNDPDGGTPGAQNSVYNAAPDTTGPALLGISITSPFSLEVCFNETMDLGSLVFVSNYAVDNGLGSPVLATPAGVGGSCVSLTFANAIDTGTVYTLTMSGLADCNGNPAGTLTGTFVQGGAAQPYQIIINEIFADESPVVGTLPEAEYVEIYNAGSSVVDLNGWVLTDRRDDGVLDAYSIMPGEYVILCAAADLADFGAFGTAIAVSGIPGLNNSGDSLELYDAQGRLIDWVYYSDDWYRDEVKADGGWSLERIDATFTCPNGDNWIASNDPNGGTPGAANSVAGTFADVTGPSLTGAFLITPTRVRLYFDELMQTATLLDPLNFTINNGVGNPTSATPIGSNPFAVDLNLATPLDTNRIYCVTTSGLLDCPGNLIGPNNEVCFGIPVEVAPGDVIINEILFNPYSGGADFVELYNNSDKIIDLSSLNIGEIYEDTDSIFNDDPVSAYPRLLLPRTYVAITTDAQFQIDTYFPPFPENIYEISSLPSFDDNEGKCVIFSDSGRVIDRLDYLDDWQFANLDDKNGVSLERHDFNRPTQDPDNWHSAASTVHYATPGYKNSQVLTAEEQTEVWLEPQTFSPDQDGNDDVLSVNYHFTTSGWNARVTVFDNKGRMLVRLQENTLLATDQGTFTWDGINSAGAKADVGVYVIYFEATSPSTGERKAYKLGCVLAARL